MSGIPFCLTSGNRLLATVSPHSLSSTRVDIGTLGKNPLNSPSFSVPISCPSLPPEVQEEAVSAAILST